MVLVGINWGGGHLGDLGFAAYLDERLGKEAGVVPGVCFPVAMMGSKEVGVKCLRTAGYKNTRTHTYYIHTNAILLT